jgi:hypothetical protein
MSDFFVQWDRWLERLDAEGDPDGGTAEGERPERQQSEAAPADSVEQRVLEEPGAA